MLKFTTKVNEWLYPNPYTPQYSILKEVRLKPYDNSRENNKRYKVFPLKYHLGSIIMKPHKHSQLNNLRTTL